MRARAKAWAIGAGGLAAGVALAFGINAGTGQGSVDAQTLPAETRVVPINQGQLLLSYSAVVKRAAPAVVNVYSARVNRSRPVNPFYQQFFGGGPQAPRVEQSLGSGVIVGPDGLIVTNNHVVAGADQILVALADRREFAAKLVFADARLDLALLQIDTKGVRLPTVPLGDSDRAEVGDVVLAIGDPFGVGQTVTHGIVSATARTGQGVSNSQYFLQTDAAINPGNSGGALLDMQGRLLGINTAIASPSGGSTGVGFAIPANMVRVFVGAAKNGKMVTGWIGAEGEALTTASAAQIGLDRPGGVLVTEVSPGSPSAAAGIKPGDIIVAVDGKEVVDPGQLRYRIAVQGVGKAVDVDVLRAGERRTFAMTLASPPENPPRALTRISGDNLLTGVTVANLSPAFAQEIGAGLPEKGVVVFEIAGTAPAARFGFLKPGDLIEAVNGQPVRTAADVARATQTGVPSVRFNRGGQRAICGVTGGQLACQS
ncbi:Do family serine endopeptidase [Glacieibacterium frigidum]|uniref:Do family serine endopeptidase n=1 Tax=Glacieibacterium frigidum TaxID=2593303 RepID=A0A552U773_9SPHN|nr:Do family serine endopeptidase [Glacieibacterium frigidum]TRW14029.1 Do family serine endopeptidase [Glacieibacterium frigidum]